MIFQIRYIGFRLCISVLLLISVSGVRTAAAAPINYNELSGGDLPHFSLATSSDFLTVDAGDNNFTGSAGWYYSTDLTDFDTASITIPTGFQVDTATFSVGRTGGTGILNDIYLSIESYDSSYVWDSRLEYQTVGIPFSSGVLSSGLPLGAGNYGFSIIGYAGGLYPEEFVTIEYTWSLSVSKTDPVPEPTTMLLLGSGLVGLAGFRRKFGKK